MLRGRQQGANLSLINSIHNSYHKESWEAMTAIKSRILQIWDSAPTPVKICCIKFVQRVILTQTASNGMEQKVRSLSILAVILIIDNRCR